MSDKRTDKMIEWAQKKWDNLAAFDKQELFKMATNAIRWPTDGYGEGVVDYIESLSAEDEDEGAA